MRDVWYDPSTRPWLATACAAAGIFAVLGLVVPWARIPFSFSITNPEFPLLLPLFGTGGGETQSWHFDILVWFWGVGINDVAHATPWLAQEEPLTGTLGFAISQALATLGLVATALALILLMSERPRWLTPRAEIALAATIAVAPITSLSIFTLMFMGQGFPLELWGAGFWLAWTGAAIATLTGTAWLARLRGSQAPHAEAAASETA